MMGSRILFMGLSCVDGCAIRGGIGLEDPLVRPYVEADLAPSSLLVGPGFWADPALIDENSTKLAFPIFVVLGKGKPGWKNSMRRLKVGYLCCPRLICHPCRVLIFLRL